ncbi:uncharacterized protein LOC112190476 [Rosa chinensis]|uniref:uncharacterized protein LOC112190476 n=1 Tax=Rosa chinensis TaxID=74649 RepID=UPI001AD8BC74|nr:uncharacterized protein LOC112190476 [Rosa chinensis]XP_040368941.1 uncharacterized protein LOC112190476 [Rosa chinensis]XP_040368942.1 uncharacterized protein LOC112190476 [Rosa chinensis]XP_040368943.1 uncharacterized protein LOC112190476 [Rosa chinensis]
MGTPEHPGRVRGVGGYVNPSVYFHFPKRIKESIQEAVKVSVQKILQEQKEKIIEEAKEQILQEHKEKIIEEAKGQIIAEERAFWVAKFTELEAKVDGRHSGTPEKSNLHVSVGSCFQTFIHGVGEVRCDVMEEAATRFDGKSVQKFLDTMEEKLVPKRVSKKKEKDAKSVPINHKQNDQGKLAEVVDNAKLEEDQAQVHDDPIGSTDLTTQQEKSKVIGVEIDAKLALGSIDHIVALATVMECDDSSLTCHDYPLGDNNVRVSVYCALDEKALVPFPVADEILTVRQAMGSWVAWPKELVIMSHDKKFTKDKADKRKRKKLVMEEDENAKVLASLKSLAPSLPAPLKILCNWGEEAFQDGRAITFEMEYEVFGYQRKTFILGSDVERIASMREVTGNCIVVYQRYPFDVLT